MPPSRRKPSNTTTTARAQQTLAFGPTPNKITKASLPTTASANKKKSSSRSHPPTDTERLQKALSDKISTPTTAPSEEADNDDTDEYPPPPERQLEEEGGEEAQSPGKKLAIRAQREKVEAEKKTRSEIEEKGARVSEAQIKRYWKGKEEERIAPRVHQKGLSVDEKILRHFDLSTQYGPCIGIPRMKRWQRADNLGLNPPLEVLAVLVKEDKSGNVKAERAFMEGLLTSRLAVNE